jgi:hypothetical protein
MIIGAFILAGVLNLISNRASINRFKKNSKKKPMILIQSAIEKAK